MSGAADASQSGAADEPAPGAAAPEFDADYARRLGAAAAERHATLGSTSDRVRELARWGAPAWTVVVADEQTRGRGRSGSTWHSPSGSGLWASLLLELPDARLRSRLPLLAGVAAARALEGLELTAPVALKWPNDLWIDGRKVGGILAEARGSGIALGLGVNLGPAALASLPADVRARATCIEAHRRPRPGSGVSRTVILADFIVTLRALVQGPDAPAAAEQALAHDWARRDLLRGHRVRVGAVEGEARGIDGDGRLLIAGPHGLEPVAAGHVEWAGTSDEP